MEFDSSESSFAKARKLMPEYPHSYFGLALVSWARYVYASDQTDPDLKKRFEREIEEAVVVSKRWLKAHPKDAEGYLALSGSYGLRSRLSVRQRRWLRALLDGRRAVKMTRKAHKVDPGMHDSLLGLGMYDYYAGTLPRFVKFFSKLILGGNRLRGIERLKIAAVKGKYASLGAQLVLIEIYTEDRWGAKDPEKALALSRPLRKRFPKSPLIHQVETVTLYEAGRFDELLTTTKEYQRRIDTGWNYYSKRDRERMEVTIGTARFAQKRLAEAESAYRAAGERAGTPEKPSRWGVWGLVRLGQVLDALDRRDEAIEAYRAAAAFPDVWGFRHVAKTGLKRPILLNPRVGQLPPP